MTLTKNVTTFAHDAVQAATDLGEHAVDLGRSAADHGLDAASALAANVAANVATAANQLAQTLTAKAPKRRSSRAPMFIVLAALAALAAFVLIRSRRCTTSVAEPEASSTDPSQADSAPAVAIA